MNTSNRLFAWLTRLPRLVSVGGALFIVAAGLIGIHYATRAPATDTLPSYTSHVSLGSISSLSSQAGPIPLTGRVQSLDQATILAQVGGEVTSLDLKLGSHVSAGTAIGYFENSAQQAAVLQAQGSYDAAQAALQKAQGSTAANSGITSQQAAQSAANALITAQTSLQSAYAALDDAVHTKADSMFSNPRSSQPQVALSIPDSQLTVNIQNERSQLEVVLSDAAALQSASQIDDAFQKMVHDASVVTSFLNDLVTATNKALPNQEITATQIATDLTAVSAARTEVASAVSALTTAKNAYDAAVAGAQSASNSATEGTTNDIAAAQATVKQAQGALNSAKAALEKTVIRSPISGTIVSLPIREGDYVTAFSQVAAVSNPGTIEVVTNVTADDAKTISVGGKALINGDVSGVIVSIAPALDPSTNKIEVKIGLTGDKDGLTDGDTVTISLDRSTEKQSQLVTAQKNITIPIISAKITPQGPVVFTVGTSSTLVAHPITLGTILGDQVTVVSGLTPEMDIVKDARGLSNGQTVVVDEN